MSQGGPESDVTTSAPISSEKRRLVGNTLANGSAQFASMLASLVFLPLLVASFGIENYGLYMLAGSAAAYAALLDLGVGTALTKFVAEHTATGDTTAASGAISSSLAFYTLVGLIVAAAMGALGVFAGVIFDVTGDQADLLRNMLWLGAVFQLFYWPMSTARHALAGLQRYDVLSLSGVLATVLNIAATLYVLWTHDGPLVLVGLSGVVGILVASVNIVIANRLLRGVPVSLRAASRTHLTAIFGFSWAIFVVQLSDVLFYQQTDRLLLGIFAGASAVGLYEAAAKFNGLMTYFSGLTVSAVLPVASSMHASGRHASLRQLLIRGTKYGSALIAPITLMLVVFAGRIIAIWLGPDFAGQALSAQVLVFPHALVCMGLMGDAIIISRGRLGKRVPYIVGQAVLNVVLSALLIPKYGVLGVAIGTSVSHLVDFPLHMNFLLKETGVSLGEWMREVVAPVYPLLLLPVAIGIGLSLTPLADSLIGIAVASAVAIGAYWVALYFVGLTAFEREEFGLAASQGWARVRRRS